MNTKWDILKQQIKLKLKEVESDTKDIDGFMQYNTVLDLMSTLELNEINEIEQALLSGKTTVVNPEKGFKQMLDVQNIRLKRLEEQSLLGDTVKDLIRSIDKLTSKVQFVR